VRLRSDQSLSFDFHLHFELEHSAHCALAHRTNPHDLHDPHGLTNPTPPTIMTFYGLKDPTPPPSMTLYTLPPPSRTFRDDKPSLLVCWWCTLFAAVIILFRVAGRYIRSEKLFSEDKLAFYCLFPLFARMAFVHVVLLYGTNNMELPVGWLGLSPGEMQEVVMRREMGSRMVLGARVFYAATYVPLTSLLEPLAPFCIPQNGFWKSTHLHSGDIPSANLTMC
jgi:hypothetical protein